MEHANAPLVQLTKPCPIGTQETTLRIHKSSDQRPRKRRIDGVGDDGNCSVVVGVCGAPSLGGRDDELLESVPLTEGAFLNKVDWCCGVHAVGGGTQRLVLYVPPRQLLTFNVE